MDKNIENLLLAHLAKYEYIFIPEYETLEAQVENEEKSKYGPAAKQTFTFYFLDRQYCFVMSGRFYFIILNILKIHIFDNFGKDGHRQIPKIRLINILKFLDMGSISSWKHEMESW